MYSVKSGNNTLYCNAISPPECPQIALKYRKCLEELGFKQYWNLFFGPPPFARQGIQSLIGIELYLEFYHNIVKSYCSIIFLGNWWIMSQWCDHDFWHCETILTKSLRIDVYPFSSRTGIEMGDSVTAGFGCGFAFATNFPCNSVLNVFKRKSFWRLGYMFVNSIHSSSPRSCSVSKQRFDHEFFTVRILMKTDHHIQDWADFVFLRIHPLARDPFWFRGNVYSRQIPSVPASSSPSIWRSLSSWNSSAAKRAEMAGVEQTKKIVPFITCEITFGQKCLRVGVWCQCIESEL